MFGVAGDKKSALGGLEHVTPEIPKLDLRAPDLGDALDYGLQAGLPAHQRPVGGLERAVADEDRFGLWKDFHARQHRRFNNAGIRHQRADREGGVGFVQDPIRFENDATRFQMATPGPELFEYERL